MAFDASNLRAALKVVAHALNAVAGEPRDWRDLSEREHLQLAMQAADKAAVGAAGGDHLAEAAARLLFALQRRQYENARGSEALRAQVDALNARRVH